MSLLISFVFIIYYFYLKIFYGGLAFSEFFLFLALILIIYSFIKDRIKIYPLLYRFLRTSLIISFIIFIFIEVLIILYPKNNANTDCDYMIILGASVKGTTPSLTLKGRLDGALDYLKNTDDSLYIVVSGGQGNGENISEASAMKNYLVKNGVSENKIILEDKSTSTFENFKYSKEKIESHSSKKIENVNVKVVTTDFHCLRSDLIAKRNGFKNITFYSSKSAIQFAPTYYTREFFAFVKTFIFDN